LNLHYAMIQRKRVMKRKISGFFSNDKITELICCCIVGSVFCSGLDHRPHPIFQSTWPIWSLFRANKGKKKCPSEQIKRPKVSRRRKAQLLIQSDTRGISSSSSYSWSWIEHPNELDLMTLPPNSPLRMPEVDGIWGPLGSSGPGRPPLPPPLGPALST
jgi:hypothetical protein